MKRLVLLTLATLSSVLLASSPIQTSDFFDLFQGNYVIENAGGTPPHDIGSTEAKILPGEGEGQFVFPFCADKFCDAGIYFVSYAETSIFKDVLNTGDDLYRIQIKDGSDTFHFEWEVSASQVIVRNLDYVWPEGNTQTLEHILRR